MSLTAERLREVLHYDPLTGVLVWRISRNQIKVGDEVRYRNKGYLLAEASEPNVPKHLGEDASHD